jgi:hypothetical protein
MTQGGGGRRRSQSQADEEAAEYLEQVLGDEGAGGTDPHDPVIVEALAILAARIAEVASYNEVGNALDKGFGNLVAQLGPLRDMGPKKLPELDPLVLIGIGQMQDVLARPNWDNVRAMPASDIRAVLDIGQPRDLIID